MLFVYVNKQQKLYNSSWIIYMYQASTSLGIQRIQTEEENIY